MAKSQKEKTDYKKEFNKDNYDRVGLYLPKGKDGAKGMKDVWKEEAKKEKMDLGEFVKKCVNEKINGVIG